MQCEQCRRQLKHAREICHACNQALSYPTSSNAHNALGVGRYQCPACSGSFDRWTTTVLPRNARWYTYQDDVPTCPLCTEPLQWKRDVEPAQLTAGLQGIAWGMLCALWITTPIPLLHAIKEHLGKWFAVLIPLLLFTMFFIALRPPLWNAGSGTGHFIRAQPNQESTTKFWAMLISCAAILTSHWATPQAARLPLWCAWLGLGAAGCLAAVLWRRSVERRKRLHTPDPGAPSPTHLS